MIYEDAKPNAAHYALAELENQGKLSAVITQNIDGLHQMAGSKNVLELHGSIHRNYCIKCNKHFNLSYIVNSPTTVPKCDACGGTIKPDVVLYEENLNMNVIDKSVHHIKQADLLIVGGTSLVVYPAAGLIDYFKGNKLVLINKSSTTYDNKADIIINDSIGRVLGSLF
jgi:NAD-dependent deacetylase